MELREEVAALIEDAAKDGIEWQQRVETLLIAQTRYLNVLDGEIQKLRKELRTRNVTSSTSLDFEGRSPSDGGENV